MISHDTELIVTVTVTTTTMIILMMSITTVIIITIVMVVVVVIVIVAIHDNVSVFIQELWMARVSNHVHVPHHVYIVIQHENGMSQSTQETVIGNGLVIRVMQLRHDAMEATTIVMISLIVVVIVIVIVIVVIVTHVLMKVVLLLIFIMSPLGNVDETIEHVITAMINTIGYQMNEQLWLLNNERDDCMRIVTLYGHLTFHNQVMMLMLMVVVVVVVGGW